MLLGSLSELSAMAGEAETSAAPGRPPLLDAAFKAFLQGQDRWAFTETHSGTGFDGEPAGETIVRIDPSLPYGEQFTPVKLRGKSPSEKQRKEWAQRGEHAARRRHERAAQEQEGDGRKDDVHLQIQNQRVTPELDRAVAIAEDDATVTYEVPMRKEGGREAELFDTFQLAARVSKARREFERVTIRQRSPMRVKLIAKLTEGIIDIEFGSPDPQLPAVPMKVSAQMDIRVLFGRKRTVQDVGVRTDFRRVTPYDERFNVKIGPVRTIEL